MNIALSKQQREVPAPSCVQDSDVPEGEQRCPNLSGSLARAAENKNGRVLAWQEPGRGLLHGGVGDGPSHCRDWCRLCLCISLAADVQPHAPRSTGGLLYLEPGFDAEPGHPLQVVLRLVRGLPVVGRRPRGAVSARATERGRTPPGAKPRDQKQLLCHDPMRRQTGGWLHSWPQAPTAVALAPHVEQHAVLRG
eukprot:CAMPEP_0175565178 /NCGR_PEP_ID=MMETSP0096-20121207/39311_1 /TAXON_ID=311494 /ORGANISM="Alexandrium monilatum, Strain CCMP3105" /LENGTH=193 /DNA_ID=CAMNT_0016868459 /DNA_START=32 /DNA_END=610 /DNA_ORIENTATION=+